MELILKIFDAFWIGIKIVINNPTFLIIIILSILMEFLYPKFRGYMGEFWVKLELKKLSKKEYIILNDIMLRDRNGTHQIDHLVISKYGIFVIEMKNYYGLITGNEYKDNWCQHLGRKKYFFKNPIHQNYGHIKSLEEILNLDNNIFISIVCFSNQAKMRVDNKSIVVQLEQLLNTIKSFNKIILEKEIDIIANNIISLNITSKEERRKHIKGIKDKIKDIDNKVNNMICPKCGGVLVTRNGKYGTFIGCSNYPKCRYTQK